MFSMIKLAALAAAATVAVLAATAPIVTVSASASSNDTAGFVITYPIFDQNDDPSNDSAASAAPGPRILRGKQAADPAVDSTGPDPAGPVAITVWAVLSTATLGLLAAAGVYVLVKAAQHRNALGAGGKVLLEYWGALFHYWTGGTYADCRSFPESLHARVHLRSLALINEMWSKPHYRNGTFGEDMRKNLRNVAVPGTGVPLSALCLSATLFRAVLLVVYPAVALAAAVVRRKPGATDADVAAAFKKHLTEPTDWFSLWRLNCRLASHHANVTGDPGFAQEDKWTFITDALAKEVPVSPIMELPSIVCKDRNEEGGMGIHFFKNALAGGDWIIQKALHNDAFLASLLPAKAPLSTIRIVTGSRLSFAPEHPTPIEAFSCVLRAGRAGAATDHDAILFDVDLATGRIKQGSINKEWYQLGLSQFSPTASPAVQSFVDHPDCGAKVTGRTVPDIRKLEQICVDAHRKCCPNVPLCGWDVALTTDGVCLLEVNLSCNFFQATVDYGKYVEFVDQHLRHLEAVGEATAKAK